MLYQNLWLKFKLIEAQNYAADNGENNEYEIKRKSIELALIKDPSIQLNMNSVSQSMGSVGHLAPVSQSLRILSVKE
jgi:hypothetical protein